MFIRRHEDIMRSISRCLSAFNFVALGKDFPEIHAYVPGKALFWPKPTDEWHNHRPFHVAKGAS